MPFCYLAISLPLSNTVLSSPSSKGIIKTCQFHPIIGVSLIGFFERVLLLCLSEEQAQLNLQQGGFRAGFSCLHSTFTFQKALSSMWEQQKVFVAFLDVKKAFDTVWHAGSMVSLFQNKVPLYIWQLLQWLNFISPVEFECFSHPARRTSGIHTFSSSLLNELLTSAYAFHWHYQLNAKKSSILVFGESPVSQKQN